MGDASGKQDSSYTRQRLVAASALLQPGIDPVFLVLLTGLGGLALADHGLVVASNQLGMAAGAVAVALVRPMPLAALRLAGLGALAASLLTVLATNLESLLACRAIFGLCNGVLYAAALAAATRRDPAHAIGTILLYQLVIATAAALLLPQIAAGFGARAALASLAGVALANLWLMGADSLADPASASAAPVLRADGNGGAAAAILLFVCGSMMVWSYVGAEGLAAGLSGTMVGVGVALASLAGGVAAWLVARASSRNRPPLPLVPAGTVAALAMLSPFAAPTSAGGFIAVMILFNLGSTYAVARFSAHAIGASHAMRRIVPALHSGGMVIGPVGAAAAMHADGFNGLAWAASAVLGLAVTALAFDAYRIRMLNLSATDTAPQQKDAEIAHSPLDANLTAVQS